MYEIIKDKPVPGRCKKYPFDNMAVGDCFIVPRGEATQNRLSSAALSAGKRYGMKFTVRKTPDGAGVWRVA